MGVRVKVDISGVKKKLSKANMSRGRYAMANQMLADMNQYVPMKQGTLRETGHANADGKNITWNTKYAKAQFYGPGGKKKKLTDKQRRFIFWALKNDPDLLNGGYSTPGTGPRWDLKAKGLHIADWEKAFLKGAGI